MRRIILILGVLVLSICVGYSQESAGVWNFVDGGGEFGINKEVGLPAYEPKIVEYNSKLYVIWTEKNGTAYGWRYQIRVAEWDGNELWSFIDGNGVNGINKDIGSDAEKPQLIVFKSELFAIWMEKSGVKYQIRVAKWDGDQSWNFVDGDGKYGINRYYRSPANFPQLFVFNLKLYATWSEISTKSQIRVAVWNEDQSWTFVDGNSLNVGINKDSEKHAYRPQLSSINSGLYAGWEEFSSTTDKRQFRIAEWDGSSTWNFIDGDGVNGINRDPNKHAQTPKLIGFNSKLYATWQESNGKLDQIRVAQWDTVKDWVFIDGDTEIGINKNTLQSAAAPQLSVYESKLFAIWQERNGIKSQIRVASWDENQFWSFEDGGGINGINYDPLKNASTPQLAILNAELYSAWIEESPKSPYYGQVRVAKATVIANNAPNIELIGNQISSEGELLEFSLSVTDPDNDNLTFFANNLPSGATFDPETVAFSWTPSHDQAGVYSNIEFTVTDDGQPPLSDTEFIIITVGDVNRPPLFDGIVPIEVEENYNVSFSLYAEDPDGDAVTYSVEAIPAGASFDTATGYFNWIPDFLQAGVYPVKFIATDDGEPAESVEMSVILTVGNTTSPTSLVDYIIEQMNGMSLKKAVLNSYIAHLKKVNTYIEAGKITPAINQVEAFIMKVQTDMGQELIDQTSGVRLIDLATELLDLLN